MRWLQKVSIPFFKTTVASYLCHFSGSCALQYLLTSLVEQLTPKGRNVAVIKKKQNNNMESVAQLQMDRSESRWGRYDKNMTPGNRIKICLKLHDCIIFIVVKFMTSSEKKNSNLQTNAKMSTKQIQDI